MPSLILSLRPQVTVSTLTEREKWRLDALVVVGTVQHDLRHGLRAAAALLQQPFAATRRPRVRGAEQGREVSLPRRQVHVSKSKSNQETAINDIHLTVTASSLASKEAVYKQVSSHLSPLSAAHQSLPECKCLFSDRPLIARTDACASPALTDAVIASLSMLTRLPSPAQVL
ncbi:hypothetical protein F2P81_021498 [Scophthalmus maximus]|uniref:Uncharacterized protein n=1 Tax=Scophthalmus maximus TaxID=52904 RepID=A0A6A4S6J7_SCOMX|nr:hypothetical protein F2P81_021498 [Scophthalmus maximus]